MTEDRIGLMLDYIGKQQNRLIGYMMTGFAVGFILGVACAFFMYSIAK